MRINRVAIVGGTHGNENTGVFLVNKLRNSLPAYRQIELDYLLANPRAIKASKRFVDVDLNRTFAMDDLADGNKSEYEFQRAREINQKLGPKGHSKTDFIIDLHTTNANMGVTLFICRLDPFNVLLTTYIKNALENCYIYYVPPTIPNGDRPFLDTIAPDSLAIEVGPIPNGVVRHDILEITERSVLAALDFIATSNDGRLPAPPRLIDLFVYEKTVFYPTDENGRINAIIHKEFQGRDFQALRKGDAIFLTEAGEIIRSQDDETLYPIFINEAAYYYKNTAFSLVRKVAYCFDVDCGEYLPNQEPRERQ